MIASGDARILIVGVDSLFGRALSAGCRHSGLSVCGTSRRSDGRGQRLDLSNPVDSWAPPDGIEIAYLFAGITSRMACQEDPERAVLINVERTLQIAERCLENGIRVVFPSSNHVFGGSRPHVDADAQRCPTTIYGRLKAEAEERLLALEGLVAVLRLGKVLAPDDPLIARWSDDLRVGRSVTPFVDFVMAPISLACAVDALLRVGEDSSGGVYQLTATEDINYAAAALHVARQVGADPGLVEPALSRDLGYCGEPCPAHTTLDGGRIARELGIAIPDPYEALNPEQ